MTATELSPVDEGEPMTVQATAPADINAAAFPRPTTPDEPGEFTVLGTKFAFAEPDFRPLPPRLSSPATVRSAARTAVSAVEAPIVVSAPPAGPKPIFPAGEPRAALRAALASRDEAAARLAAARAALARGEAVLADVAAAVRRVAEAEQAEVADFGVRLKKWVANGAGERPQVTGASTTARAEAETELAAARLARDGLANDVVARQTELTAAEMRIEGAVIAILQTEAAGITQRLATLEDTAAELRAKLSAMATLWVGQVGPMPLPASTVAALRATPANVREPATTTLAGLRERWSGYLRELRDNPEARFDG